MTHSLLNGLFEAGVAYPRRRTTGLSTQQVGAELLVYDEELHQAFCLNGTAALVWQLCDGASDAEKIAAAVRARVDGAFDEDMVLLALDDLRRDGLLMPEPSAPLRAQLSRRALMSRLGTGALLLVPTVAMIAAPKAAQAYNGCFDCVSPQAQKRKAQHTSDSE